MKKLIIAALFVGLASWVWAQQGVTPPSRPDMTWNAFVFSWQDYDSSGVTGTHADGVVSAFIPETSIEVTRVRVEAVNGPYQSNYAENNTEACTVPPGLEVTDGTKSYTLPLTNGGSPVSSSNDSGQLGIRFPAGATIRMVALQGNFAVPDVNSGCSTAEANVTVQYRRAP